MHPALGIGTGKLGTKCGACEPLQSPTDVALEMSGSAELCRERPNLNSRNKYYDDSHTTDKDARHPEELALRREKRRVAPPNSLHQRVRIALCFALCAGCKLRNELHVRHDGLTGREDGLQLLFCAANEDLLNRNHSSNC